MKRKSCENSENKGRRIPKMLRFTPGKPVDADDINTIITPPAKSDGWFPSNSPASNDSKEHDGSFTEMCRKPLGRFLSFDVKRSLFSSKRLSDQAEDSPCAKKLRDAEDGISDMSMKALSHTLDSDNVKSVVHRLSTDKDVIADGSRTYTLPTVVGKHSDLKAISPETMNDVLRGCYDEKIDQVTIIDCRYPYEYDGGHIKDAINLYTRTGVEEFLSRHSSSHTTTKKHLLIFHCEFSSERGPKMYRHLRSEDRAMNSEHYPRLNFPEIYLLEGGYKAFYYKFMVCRKPLGRFLSFDVKRSLFSSKRLSDQDENSPCAKKLRDAEDVISDMSVQSTTQENDNVKSVVHRLSTDKDVIADGSRTYILPTVTGKHSDLKAITPETMNDVLRGCYDDKIDQVTIIDCRYPYEYDGGHIKDAINLYTRTGVEEFLSRHSSSHTSTKKHVLIFHCEFSSERGPKMYRHLRSEDRAMNSEHYPRLNFPEIYLLEGGYKAFYYKFMEQCSPQTYKPMLHKDHAADLRHFRGKSKSWTAGERTQPMRAKLRF